MADLEAYFDQYIDTFPPGREGTPVQTAGFERLMQRAIAHVQFSGKREVDAGDILAAIFAGRHT
jgi:ATP-dependent Clp protease ATP-binding subunit ClpA